MNELKIADGTIAYTKIDGDPALPHLVFLHEGLGCTAMWGDFPQRLCEASGCPGLVYDRLGYGRSSALPPPWSADYLQTAATRDLPQVVDCLLPAEASLIVFGHSDGGSIALIYGAMRPERLLGIVTEAAHVFVEKVTLAAIRDAVAAYDSGKLSNLARYHGAKTEQVFRGWSDTWLDPRFATWNIEALLPRIEVPLLAMQGEHDRYGTALQLQSITGRSAGPAKAALLPGCGHTPHKEAPEAVLSVTVDFIRSATKRTPLDRRAV
jgi:pimeloyl-ACP methyl ester carboxylesterase